MFGSLQQFIQLNEQLKPTIQDQQKQQTRRKTSIQQKNNIKSYLSHEVQSKQFLLASKTIKQKNKQILAQQMLKQALQQKHSSSKMEKKHWVEYKSVGKTELKHKHSLLRAINKIKQKQGYTSKSLFERSIDRITSAYQKIIIKPVDMILPSPTNDINKIYKKQRVKSLTQIEEYSNTIDPKKLLSLQSSVKWAKKHGKNVKSFYQQLGKSFQLINHQKPGRSNYFLQRQQQSKEQQNKRRYQRKKNLKQIQSRLKNMTIQNKNIKKI